MRRRVALVGALALFGIIAACRPAPPTKPPEIDRIAIVGHGVAFDARMHAIPIDLATIVSMQKSLRSLLAGAKLPEGDGPQGFVSAVEGTIAQTESGAVRALLTGALINWQLQRADDRLRRTYEWRNRFLVEHARDLLERGSTGPSILPDAVQRLLRDSGLVAAAPDDGGYRDECRANGVPVPPDFSMRDPGEWVHQGDLVLNMLAAGQPASVWTWTDPVQRGACVALPRNNGGPGTVTGIICQSASSGRACFWDNLTRADPTRRIPSATETMVMHDLQDGRTLAEDKKCTSCHAGNNVFLMAPDDPTWARLMRGPMIAGTFTTIVEPQTDSPRGPRYTPIAHSSWINPPLRLLECAGACHAAPSADVLNIHFTHPTPAPMPPQCAKAEGGEKYHLCYQAP